VLDKNKKWFVVLLDRGKTDVAQHFSTHSVNTGRKNSPVREMRKLSEISFEIKQDVKRIQCKDALKETELIVSSHLLEHQIH